MNLNAIVTPEEVMTEHYRQVELDHQRLLADIADRVWKAIRDHFVQDTWASVTISFEHSKTVFEVVKAFQAKHWLVTVYLSNGSLFLVFSDHAIDLRVVEEKYGVSLIALKVP